MFLSKRKNGYYYLFISDNLTGKRKMISCKTKRKPEALKFLNTYSQDARIETQRKQVMYFEDLQKEVLKYVTDNLRKTTVQIYLTTFKEFHKVIGNKAIQLITTNDIELFKSKRLKEVKPATVNIHLTTLKAIFNIAIKLNWLDTNPMNRISKIKIPEKEILAFKPYEIDLIMDVIQDKGFKNIVEFAILTGCRLNEILNIQLKDIDLIERIITIQNKPDFKTKTGKIRQIPISDKLYTLLRGVIKQGEGNIFNFNPDLYLFNKNGHRYEKDFISKKFKKYLRFAGLPEKFHFHCLRHTFISNLIKKGVNINYVKELAGHSDIQTTMGYIHINTSDLREAVNKI